MRQTITKSKFNRIALLGELVIISKLKLTSKRSLNDLSDSHFINISISFAYVYNNYTYYCKKGELGAYYFKEKGVHGKPIDLWSGLSIEKRLHLNAILF